jgi:hypothetical protein
VPKYKQYIQKMLDENRQAFDEFQKLHDKYELNPDALQGKGIEHQFSTKRKVSR